MDDDKLSRKVFWFFLIVAGIISWIMTGLAYGSVSDMEKAEKDNMLQMAFNITDAQTTGGTNEAFQVQMQTGLLSQSYVKYGIYAIEDSTQANAHKKTLCYSGTVGGADDEAGWYKLATQMNLIVASRETTPANSNTLRNLFVASTLTENISLPSEFSVLQENLNGRLGLFNEVNASEAASYLLHQYDAIYDGSSPADASLAISNTTTTSTTASSATTGAANHCGDVLTVEHDKFFYGMLHWHNRERKPMPGSNSLTFSQAVRAAAHSMAVVSSDVDITCFLSQYRDDVQALMMSFKTMETWAMVFLVSSIILYLLLFGFGTVYESSVLVKILYSVVTVVAFLWLIAIPWYLKSQVGAVMDEVKYAVSTVTCPSEHIAAVYKNDNETHAEHYFMAAFIVNIVALVLAFGTYWMAETVECGARAYGGYLDWSHFNVDGSRT